MVETKLRQELRDAQHELTPGAWRRLIRGVQRMSRDAYNRGFIVGERHAKGDK